MEFTDCLCDTTDCRTLPQQHLPFSWWFPRPGKPHMKSRPSEPLGPSPPLVGDDQRHWSVTLAFEAPMWHIYHLWLRAQVQRGEQVQGIKRPDTVGIHCEKAIPVSPIASPPQREALCLLGSAAWFHPLAAQEQLSEDDGDTNKRKEGQRDRSFFNYDFHLYFINNFKLNQNSYFDVQHGFTVRKQQVGCLLHKASTDHVALGMTQLRSQMPIYTEGTNEPASHYHIFFPCVTSNIRPKKI